MNLTLYAFPRSPRSFKVLWAANHLDIAYEMKLVDFTKNGQNEPAYLQLNPNGRAPALQHDGFVLWESNAIVEYLASLKPGLLPNDTRARLAVTKWLYWDSAHWDSACAIFAFERVVKPLFGRGEAVQSEIDRGTAMFKRIGRVLDGELAKHAFVAGAELSVADIALASPFCLGAQAGFPLGSYPAIMRWKTELEALPSWKKTLALAGAPA